MAVNVYIGLGANINPQQNILKSLDLLLETEKIKAISPFYRSAPAGGLKQADYINGVCRINTDICPRELKFNILRKIESRLGRIRSEDINTSRPIDLDILLYGKKIIREDDLTIPDPQISKYPFIFIPLLDLEPQIKIPPQNLKLKDVVNVKTYCQAINKMVEFSRIIAERYGL